MVGYLRKYQWSKALVAQFCPKTVLKHGGLTAKAAVIRSEVIRLGWGMGMRMGMGIG